MSPGIQSVGVAMRYLLLSALIAAGLTVGVSPAGEKKSSNASPVKLPGSKGRGEPIPGYERRNVDGFMVLINKKIMEESFEGFEKKPFDVFEEEIKGVERVIKSDMLKELKRVPIWLEWDQGRPAPDGGQAVAVYHAGAFQAYTRLGRMDQLKANNVEVLTLKLLTQLKQPKKGLDKIVLLHELIHAVHDKVLSVDNPEIKNAFEQARRRDLYVSVEHRQGPKREAYANTNHVEYFAEISCAYLDRIEYFPYDREGLKRHDPVGYAVAEKVWGKVAAKKDRPAPPSKGTKKASGAK